MRHQALLSYLQPIAPKHYDCTMLTSSRTLVTFASGLSRTAFQVTGGLVVLVGFVWLAALAAACGPKQEPTDSRKRVKESEFNHCVAMEKQGDALSCWYAFICRFGNDASASAELAYAKEHLHGQSNSDDETDDTADDTADDTVDDIVQIQ